MPVSQLTFTLAAPCGRLGHGIRLGMAVPHVEALAFTSMLARRRLLLPALGESASPCLAPPRRTAAPLLRSLGDIEPRTRSAQGARRHKSPQRLQHVRLAWVWPGSDWGSGPGPARAMPSCWPTTKQNCTLQLPFSPSDLRSVTYSFPFSHPSPAPFPLSSLFSLLAASLFFLLQQNLRNINYVL